MSALQARVVRKTREAQDIVSFELAGVDGQALPPFSAGSHIDVHLPGGLVRQYSLCNAPSEQHRYVIGVLRDPASRGGSSAMHDIEEGALLQISAPRNHFPLLPARRTLLLAGGIGVTPILCMAERLAQTGADFEMHYCSRAPERAAFQARIRQAPFADRVHFHYDTGAPEQQLDLAALTAQAAPDTHLYVCGPAGFIEHVLGTAKQQGWDGARLHVEYFGAAPRDSGGDSAFAVRLASSGKVYTVAAGQSVTRALAEQGIELPVSCEQGVCGTCITRVLEGVPEHRDQYFTDDERALNDQFTPCCSRAKSALLVLDL